MDFSLPQISIQEIMRQITLQHIAFLILAGITLGSALLVVSLRNIFHSLLFLALSFLGVAGIYLLLSADFLAAAQVLIYIGAITVLLMFALMMTHRVMSKSIVQTLAQWWVAPLAASAGLLALLVRLFVFNPWNLKPTTAGPTTGIIGQALLTKYLLPFELASIVLLVAMVGAIVLAKDDRPTEEPPEETAEGGQA